MTKESGYSKSARSGEDGFKHDRGGEDAMPHCEPAPCGNRTGRTPPSQAGAGKVPEAHGFGHKGKQIDGVHRLSGNPKAHRIGKK
jgi:hypothetical protein